MKKGFWMMDFQVLQTEVQVMMGFIGRCSKTLVRISQGRESYIVSSSICNSSVRELEISSAK